VERLDRRDFLRFGLVSTAAPLFGALAPVGVNDANAAPRTTASTASRTVREFLLPAAAETLVLVLVPGSGTILVMPQKPSQLVKVTLNNGSGLSVSARAFRLGAADADAHGLAVSRAYRGRVWCTLEHENRVLLVNPHASRPDAAPTAERSIDVPGGAQGPHYVAESGDELWVTCTQSDQILRINHRNTAQYRLYQASSHPIFVVRLGTSPIVYASQDKSSAILRIDSETHDTRQIPIPAKVGTTPVGLVAGPQEAWVALLGTKEHATGTFGRLDAAGNAAWFTLSTPQARDSGLLHLGFPATRGRTLWLVSSSIINASLQDALIRIEFDPTFSRVISEQTASLPTQLCKAHRVLPFGDGAFATELTTATLAYVGTKDAWNARVTSAPDSGHDEPD